MSHDHTHAAFAAPTGGKIESRFILALALTGLILVAEIIGGLWTGSLALSAHVVLADQALSQTHPLMDALKELIAHRFGIEHTTIQFECRNCGQGPVVCLNETA